MALLPVLHVLSAVLWVGGMFFAHQVLRPVAAGLLEPPVRLRLWLKVFDRFFPWVQAAVIVLAVTGAWMIVRLGGLGRVGWYVHAMLTLALAMFAIFGYVQHRLLRALRGAVDNGDWPAGGAVLGRIRRLVGINLLLGLVTVAVASGGRHFAH
ncbi:CopD family protein [Candidatus Methylocalor cossyra]|uniref:CopD domain-containing protein n=1 Tax=Candidatus Methylocalor cossyra TaxID=3108543 RepID=A0ABP1CAM3_9GAMM